MKEPMIKLAKETSVLPVFWILLFVFILVTGCSNPSKYNFKKAERITVTQTNILLKKPQRQTLSDSIAKEEYLLDLVSLADSLHAAKNERSPVHKSLPKFEVFIPLFCDSLKVIDINSIQKKHRNLLYNALSHKVKKDKEIINMHNKLVVRFLGRTEEEAMEVFEHKYQENP